MIETPLDLAFFCFAGVVMAITALKPQWTIYVLTYGRPERFEGHESRFALTRIIAAIGAISIVVTLAIDGLHAAGL